MAQSSSKRFDGPVLHRIGYAAGESLDPCRWVDRARARYPVLELLGLPCAGGHLWGVWQGPIQTGFHAMQRLLGRRESQQPRAHPGRGPMELGLLVVGRGTLPEWLPLRFRGRSGDVLRPPRPLHDPGSTPCHFRLRRHWARVLAHPCRLRGVPDALRLGPRLSQGCVSAHRREHHSQALGARNSRTVAEVSVAVVRWGNRVLLPGLDPGRPCPPCLTSGPLRR